MSDQHPLTLEEIGEIADRYYQAFPDVRAMAREWAKSVLKRHTGMNLNPDHIYWNHFDNAQNNGQCHSGWQHYGPPDRSMTVTELVMRRFNLNDQINAIDLDSTSGFYHVYKSPRFDQSNEVPLLPSTIMQDFWSNDFSAVYRQKLDLFWQQQTLNGRALLKAIFFGQAWRAHTDGVLDIDPFKVIVHTLSGATALPPTLQSLYTENTQRTFAKVYSFTLGQEQAADILRIKCPDDSEVLYMPPSWFKRFDSQQAMYTWLRHEAADPQQRAQLLRHFGDYSLDEETREALGKVLNRIQARPWAQGQADLNAHSVEITQDVFTFLLRNVRRRLDHDVELLLQSNYELRRELFLEDLDALVRLSSGLAPGDPLIALVTIGAASLSFGSHLARSISGKDRQERQIAFRKALLDAVTLLLELPLLKGAGKNHGRLADLEFESHELPTTSSVDIESLPYQAYAVSRDISGLAEGSGTTKAVYTLDARHQYIRMKGQVLQVRYVDRLDRWYVIDPQDTDNMALAWPVSRDWRGRWVPFVAIELPPAQGVEREVDATPSTPALRQYETRPDYEPLIEVLTGRDAARLLTGPLDSVFRDARDELLRLRQSLARNSLDVLVPRVYALRPAVPEVSSAMRPARFLETVYSDAYGLIIGESRGSVASKKLLIKYMPQLKDLGVDTLFVEGLLKDLDQKWIDLYWRTGHMPISLEKRLLELYNQATRLDVGRFSHYRLLTEARRAGIKIRALDCAASISADGLQHVDPAVAQRMRIYYASERIKAHQARLVPSRWVALLDQTRAGAHLGVKGVAELTGSVHLRVKDIDRLLPTRFSVDLGEVLKSPPALVKGDIKLEMGTLEDILANYVDR
ncbi:membrane-targeted effector domain-containing toxin [Pseudomonas sp. dw_358]|uniref:membrane-targeted effector domain-containing toxin n=1 Tax=Pseudomonas sp. dw_358 TaxID=2720083 RepID=UPI001BD35FA8|nr:membrane-targeted effector domain-containing toxin [Pseudomonas sp. dw_358]